MIALKKWSLVTHISLFILFTIFMFFNIFETLDYRLQDALYQESEVTNPDIVIVGIDDESLNMLGRWPWPRDYHGELIRLIGEGEPS
ncbi:MAG: CHASE2 domain-containing protein, partial [Lutispora sp.]